MEIDPAAAWNGLEEPWRVCLSLAWEAYGAGTIPVGAALVDSEGAVVAQGRNRVYEHAAPPRQLANSLLAHAEVNALLALDPERRYEDHVLYTALEPCLLCVGATVMTTVGRIRYAGADPYGGADGALTGGNVHTELPPPQPRRPRGARVRGARARHARGRRAPSRGRRARARGARRRPTRCARGDRDVSRAHAAALTGATSAPFECLRALTTRSNVQLPFPLPVSTLTLRMSSGRPQGGARRSSVQGGGKGTPN